MQMRDYDVRAMEHYVATDKRPVDVCLSDVEACDVYVGIFALRYGYVPSEDNPEGRSITELEYRKATAIEKPRLIFLLKESSEWSSDQIDGVTGENERGAKIEAFRTELAGVHTLRYFTSPSELASQVSVAINEWEKRRLYPHDSPHTIRDERTNAILERLKTAYQQEKTLIIEQQDHTAIRNTIRNLKRQLREGGQLQSGDFLMHDRFELLEPIGQGGFARVWKAYDQQRRELVALKVLRRSR